jgi:hypothetical protein
MSKLQLRGQQIESVFELLGVKENDVSFSVGWALANSPAFLAEFINLAVSPSLKFDVASAQIRLQQYESTKGITDIEIEIPTQLFFIIEAKRGWVLPSESQLFTYARRLTFKNNPAQTKKLIVLTECSEDYAKAHFKLKDINGITVLPLSWKQVFDAAQKAYRHGSHTEKRLLWELATYFQRIMTMQKNDSNLVYIVSLGSGKPHHWKISWIDIITKKSHYFHPIGGKGGWPVSPPNYLAFRYYGQLQAIHHVERYEVFTNPHSHFPEIPSDDWIPHYLYHLGQAFAPSKVVRTGRIYPSGRVWCALDTLFTVSTISEARDITKKRMGWS